MAGIDLTDSRRSQLLEQLLAQQAQQPQVRSGISLAARLGEQLLRQQKIKKLRQEEAGRQATRGKNQDAVLAALLGENTQSVFGTDLPQNTTASQAASRLPTDDPLRQALQSKVLDQAFATPEAPDEFTLSPGQTRFRGSQPIASVTDKPAKPSKAAFIDASTGTAHQGTFDGGIYRTSSGRVVSDARPIAPAAGQKDIQNNREQFRPIEAATATALGEIDNLINQISDSPTPEALISVLGTGTRGISAMVSQARGAAALFARLKPGEKLKATVGGETVNEDALFDVDLYKFGDAAIGSAQVQSNILSLAYSIARTQDPGGRLSDKDVQAAIDILTGPDVPQTLAKLQETRRRTVSTFKNDAVSRDLQDRVDSFEQRFGVSLDNGLSAEDDAFLKKFNL